MYREHHQLDDHRQAHQDHHYPHYDHDHQDLQLNHHLNQHYHNDCFYCLRLSKEAEAASSPQLTKITKNGHNDHIWTTNTLTTITFTTITFTTITATTTTRITTTKIYDHFYQVNRGGAGGRVTFSNKNRRCCDSIGIVTYHALQMTMTMTMTMFPKLVTEKHFLKTILAKTI